MRKYVQPIETVRHVLPAVQIAGVQSRSPKFVSLSMCDHVTTIPHDWSLWKLPVLENDGIAYGRHYGETFSMYAQPYQIGERKTGFGVGAVLERYKELLRKPAQFSVGGNSPHRMFTSLFKKPPETLGQPSDARGMEETNLRNLSIAPKDIKSHISEPDLIFEDSVSKVYYLYVTHVFKRDKEAAPEKIVEEYYLVADEVPWEGAPMITDFWVNAYHPSDPVMAKEQSLELSGFDKRWHGSRIATSVALDIGKSGIAYGLSPMDDKPELPLNVCLCSQTVPISSINCGDDPRFMKVTRADGSTAYTAKSMLSEVVVWETRPIYVRVTFYTENSVKEISEGNVIENTLAKLNVREITEYIKVAEHEPFYAHDERTGNLAVFLPIDLNAIKILDEAGLYNRDPQSLFGSFTSMGAEYSTKKIGE